MSFEEKFLQLIKEIGTSEFQNKTWGEIKKIVEEKTGSNLTEIQDKKDFILQNIKENSVKKEAAVEKKTTPKIEENGGNIVIEEKEEEEEEEKEEKDEEYIEADSKPSTKRKITNQEDEIDEEYEEYDPKKDKSKRRKQASEIPGLTKEKEKKIEELRKVVKQCGLQFRRVPGDSADIIIEKIQIILKEKGISERTSSIERERLRKKNVVERELSLLNTSQLESPNTGRPQRNRVATKAFVIEAPRQSKRKKKDGEEENNEPEEIPDDDPEEEEKEESDYEDK
eukprot:TRINITY_DN7809_c0_g1_i1.p1 TRINITY_DN7809_c0_g1~~TRINITY_DN7809_c0_g1_i1.p1  ORF type:complete len:283 (-),score=135.93 TRINITY_DN7809_c0_g1_i1:112-960(-)